MKSSVNVNIVFDHNLVEFYKAIANQVGVYEDDIDQIFNIPSHQPTVLEEKPTRVRFELQDKYKADFECEMSNAMLLKAENQRNKTTCLLAMATLLGYSWDNQENLNFLEDLEFVKKGQAIQKLIQQGRKSLLEFTKGNNYLMVLTDNGKAIVSYRAGGAPDLQVQEFSLSKWDHFENCMSQLVDVQLISKGRKFIQQVESDILDNLRSLGEILSQNSHKLLKEYDFRNARLAPKRQSTKQVDKQTIVDIETRLQQIEKDKQDQVTLRAKIRAIQDYLRELDKDRAIIEGIFRLERELQAVVEAEQESVAYHESLQAKKQEVEELGLNYLQARQQKEKIDLAFEQLQKEIADLLDKGTIAASSELDALRERIINSDIQGVCNFSSNHQGLNYDSVKIYEALIETIENAVLTNTTLLPFGDHIYDTSTLLSHLRQDLDKARNLVVIREVIEKFTNYLRQEKINISQTPYDYQSLENQVLNYEQELRLAEADLKAQQESPPSTAQKSNIDELKSRIEKANQELSQDTQSIRESIEEIAKTLDGPLDIRLNLIWSANAIPDLSREERKVSQLIVDLRKEQLNLQQQKQQLEEALKADLDLGVETTTDERVERINKFIQNVLLLMDVASAKTDQERNNVLSSIKALEDAGFAQSFKETIDALIAKRCQYYYDNSGELCQPLRLETVIYEQSNRNIPQFKVGGQLIERTALSGGTESVMTVRSLASRLSAKPFGVVLLVDEWGDVQEIGRPLYEDLKQMKSVLATVFIKVEKNVTELTPQPIN